MKQEMYLCIRCKESLTASCTVNEITGTVTMGKCMMCRKPRALALFAVSDKKTAGAGTPTAENK